MTTNNDLTCWALERISTCSVPKELRSIADNAKRLANEDVEKAALRRLYAVSPEAEPGTLEHDVWQSVFALEDALRAERGKTTLLSRSRQKIARDGPEVTEPTLSANQCRKATACSSTAAGRS